MNKHTLLAFALTCWAAGLLAQVPIEMNYQGYLVDASGNPATGTVNVAIALYTEPVGGMAVYSEAIGAVELNKGIYSFQWGRHGTSVVQAVETMGVTDGSSAVFNYTVEHPPIINPSVLISSGTYSWSDTAGSSDPSFLGSVSSYASGAVSAVFLGGAPGAGQEISISYSYLRESVVMALRSQIPLWMGITIDGAHLGPRQMLAAVPVSLRSLTTDAEDSLVGQQVQAGSRIDLLETKYQVLSIEAQAYNNPSGNSVQTTAYDYPSIIAEAFSRQSGLRGTVLSSTPGAFDGARHVTAQYIANTTTVSAGLDWAMVKQVSVNMPVHSVSNEIRADFVGTSAPQALCYIQFQYIDGTSANSITNSSGADLVWRTRSYTNPNPHKFVSSVRVYLRHTFISGNTASERNTSIRAAGHNDITITLQPQIADSVLSTMLVVRGSRQPGDSITYSITDGTNTEAGLRLDVVNRHDTLSAPPVSYTIHMRASTLPHSTWGGTSINAAALRYWVD